MRRTPLRRYTRLRPVSKKRCLLARDWGYMAWIRLQPCLVCGERSEAAHTGARAYSRKSPDRQCVPLCGKHHRYGRDSLHTLGPVQFDLAHGFVVASLVRLLNAKYEMEVLCLAS
jgi:hypothetical protein